jgi:hypothetical protein
VATSIVNEIGRARLRRTESMALLLVAVVATGIFALQVRAQSRVAADTVAAADIRTATPAIRAYALDGGTYVGMTAAALARYDGELPGSLAFARLTRTSYCVAVTVYGRVWHQDGPGGAIEQGAC